MSSTGEFVYDNHEHTSECYDEAVAYVAQVDGYAKQLLTDMPVTIRARLRGYYRQPTPQLNEDLAEEIAQDVFARTAATYDGAETDRSDVHQRATFFTTAYGRAIAQIKTAVYGGKSPVGPAAGLMMRISGKVAWNLPPIDPVELDKIKHTAEVLLASGEPLNMWYQVRLAHIMNGYDSRRISEEFLTRKEADADDEQLRSANDELYASIQFLQKYVPKQCIAPALPDQETKEWLVAKPFDAWKDRYHPAHSLKAAFFGASVPIESSNESVMDYGEGGLQMQIIHFPGLPANGMTLVVGLGPNGDLYSTIGQRWLDYLQEDQLPAYEQLRSELLCIYHDSVVPVYVTELADQEAQAREAEAQKESEQPESQTAKLMRLVLARKLVAETLQDEITDELDNPDRDLVQNHRELAKHEVTGHIRRLPANSRASQEARNQCIEDMGVVLAEYGETYVRTHERGSVDKPTKGHKAVFTAGRMATGLATGSSTA